MKKTTIGTKIAAAFLTGTIYNIGDTKVGVNDREVKLYLQQGHVHYEVAISNSDGLYLQYPQSFTAFDLLRQRLNHLPDVCIYQQKYQLHLNGKPWNGSVRKVSSLPWKSIKLQYPLSCRMISFMAAH